MVDGMNSLLRDLLAQIRGSRGDSAGMAMGKPLQLSPEERLARGIDPRDPNKFAVDDNGQMIQTLIAWNPDSAPYRQAPGQRGQEVADQVSGWQPSDKGMGGMLGNLLSSYTDQGAGGQSRGKDLAEMVSGMKKPNFFRPSLPRPNGDISAIGKQIGNSMIPKAKEKMTRVSPGVYRNAKGNLVRK